MPGWGIVLLGQKKNQICTNEVDPAGPIKWGNQVNLFKNNSSQEPAIEML